MFRTCLFHLTNISQLQLTAKMFIFLSNQLSPIQLCPSFQPIQQPICPAQWAAHCWRRVKARALHLLTMSPNSPICPTSTIWTMMICQPIWRRPRSSVTASGRRRRANGSAGCDPCAAAAVQSRGTSATTNTTNTTTTQRHDCHYNDNNIDEFDVL